jgi:non-canonical purine NTP pyrophosphatase (RdgB/HAM1 family)
MELYFVTGNKNKFEEAKAVIPDLRQLDIDLPEIQEIDAKIIIKEKLLEALKHQQAGFIVEDTSLYFDCINGLPGPLIKWFLKTVGNEGLYKIVQGFGNPNAQAKTMIGYARSADDIHYFEGVIDGTIVAPRGETNFGWDPIFQPVGHDRTFAEMAKEEKNSMSMRRMAFENLKEYIDGASSHE